MPDFSEIKLVSLLAYTRDPTNDEEKLARNRALSLKQDKPVPSRALGRNVPASAAVAAWLRSDSRLGWVRDFIGADAVLVPVPGHGVGRPEEALWVPDRIARALREQGIGATVQPLLSRRVAIRKSAGAEQRPSPVEHFESLHAEVPLGLRARLVLVDDVVTRGSTMLGAAARLRAAMADVEIRAFAVFRVPRWGEFRAFIDPCRSTIRLIAGGMPLVESEEASHD